MRNVYIGQAGLMASPIGFGTWAFGGAWEAGHDLTVWDRSARLVDRSFRPSLTPEDLRLVTETAERSGLDSTLAAATRGRLERAAADGAGDLGYSAVVATISAATPTRTDEEG